MIGAQFVLAARVLIGLVFAVAAVGKLAGRTRLLEFADSLAPLGRSPVGWLPIAAGTAVAELAVAVLVGFSPTYRLGLGLATAVMLVTVTGSGDDADVGRRARVGNVKDRCHPAAPCRGRRRPEPERRSR